MQKRLADRTSHFSISGIREMFNLVRSDSINLGLGQPDFDTPLHIKEAAKRAIDEGFTGYTPNKGYPELLDAVSGYYSQYSVESKRDNIIITSGGSEGLHLAFEAVVNPGDEVLLPDPGFVAYRALTHIAGGTPVSVPLISREEFKLSPDVVGELITSKTKALVVNSPANPTGAIQDYPDIKALVELAQDHDFFIISDEVYDKILYEGMHISPASIDAERVIVVNATSKTYAMTGWRLGYTIASPSISEEMLKIHQYMQACASSISQKAAYVALTGPQDFTRMMVSEFKRRRDVIMQKLVDIADCVTPRGAFYVFPKFTSHVNSQELALKLARAGVIVVGGNAFGKFGEGYIRLSYATSMENIDRAINIIRHVTE